ncbi:hypothetical protein EDD30_1294 [Couchioplanes caeruleus]|uniref:Lantipeptide n=2 Tax=Couchioplanes caeruleus TaxID=56438 RepID=A0A1K0FTB1_9ACTN|nr:Lantipeptide precursor [Couchioplanes caeruleus subsp. caeruleus]ROP28530.1 hypothetical protein EDD30_1294 [Couchioplanes caeruleus]
MSEILELQATEADTGGVAAWPCLSIFTSIDCG